MTDRQNQTVRVERCGAVAHLRLNRPESLNAWTPELGTELLDAVRSASADPQVRAMLLSGEGRAFSAGADLKNARTPAPDGNPDLSSRLLEIYNPVILAVRAAPKPVIGAINGAAAGVGCSLALACDLLVAAESSYLLLAFVKVGLMPDAGALRFLTERVGLARAAELCMLGERLPARQAWEWGLVNRVVPDHDLLPEAMAMATRLAAGPTVALANIKRTLNETTQADLGTQIDMEADRQQEHAGIFDYIEGRTAFVEKRTPQFLGR